MRALKITLLVVYLLLLWLLGAYLSERFLAWVGYPSLGR